MTTLPFSITQQRPGFIRSYDFGYGALSRSFRDLVLMNTMSSMSRWRTRAAPLLGS
jgi:hypothetical protein